MKSKHLLIFFGCFLLPAADFLSVDELVHQIIHNQSNTTHGGASDHFNADNEQISDDDDFNRNDSATITPVPDPARNRINLLSSFPPDFMSDSFRCSGGFVIHIIIFLYLTMALTLVIDSYFIPSLQFFSLIYNLSPNITGSTLMVLGTSLPEFFTSIINVFMGEASIGTGAIVASSVFNVLAIPGICGLAATQRPMQFKRWPVRREIIFYAITIIVFILGVKDNSIDWLESLVFMLIYAIYLFCLYLWSHFEITLLQSSQRRFLRKDRHWIKYTRYLQQSQIGMKPTAVKTSTQKITSYGSSPLLPSTSRNRGRHRHHHHHHHHHHHQEHLYHGCIAESNVVIRYTMAPILLALAGTIPRASRRSFIGTYILSSVWILAITYLLIWMISLVAESLHFSHSASVMTMLALSNITKLISSVIVVKRLHSPDMAICHVLGSNIFNILICLGLPWFLRIFILAVKEGLPLEELQAYTVPLDDSIFEYVAASLTILVLIFILIFYLSDWKLTTRSSVSFLLIYVSFLTILLLLDQTITI